MTRPDPDSVVRVLQAIERQPGIGAHGLQRETGLAQRTVRFALRRLRDQGRIVGRQMLRDARRTLYTLKVKA